MDDTLLYLGTQLEEIVKQLGKSKLVQVGNLVFNPSNVLIDFEGRKLYNQEASITITRDEAEALKWYMSNNAVNVMGEYLKYQNHEQQMEDYATEKSAIVEKLLALNVPKSDGYYANKYAEMLLDCDGGVPENEWDFAGYVKANTTVYFEGEEIPY